MKLVTCQHKSEIFLSIFHENKIYDLKKAAAVKGEKLASDMSEFLAAGDSAMELAKTIDSDIKSGRAPLEAIDISQVELLAPITRPTSLRDGYAFRQHVAAARRNRGVEMIPEFDQYPIFYFSNHNAVQGPGDVWCMKDHFSNLDFELEWAVIMGKSGKNIHAEKADSYIAGFTIMNDLSARTLQMEEMKLNLGPAKGKDFSTAIGPFLVTPDELMEYLTSPKPGHTGNSYRLKMTCKVNGIQVSAGNTGDMDWTFAEIIERCSYGVSILPGDVIGSGTVGTGCFLELNGTGKLNNPDFKPQWLMENDTIEMEITGLGKLINTVRRVDSDFSILSLKKMQPAQKH
ncbi:MAG: fumarylacetoacetate hydrolase family protein [Bacteroidia bacterium]|nr:fumarylacetoacetate hydrolase family protein [Bacteroidia bacterium]MCZ2277146.1 fumarylacetoacetate hydrolase family protein [Bacteroidia bacterium]